MEFIVGIHSLVRWLVVIVAVVAVVRYALVMAGRAQRSGMDRGLMSGYTGLLDFNVLLGLIIIVGLSISAGQVLMVWLEHAVTNIIGVVVAHSSRSAPRRSKMPNSRRAPICWASSFRS